MGVLNRYRVNIHLTKCRESLTQIGRSVRTTPDLLPRDPDLAGLDLLGVGGQDEGLHDFRVERQAAVASVSGHMLAQCGVDERLILL
jgi:hypothetical protein